MDREKTRIARRVFGMVQGVGFRPFVARIAKAHGISGYVKNCGGYVEILAEAPEENVRSFLHDLLSFSGIIRVEEIAPSEFTADGFIIEESAEGAALPPMIPPDLPMCKSCEAELFEKSSRRYRHPFISCAACGARYSVIEVIPYDRPRTTMGAFPLCSSCDAEYNDIENTRHFAQTICCNFCGPTLHFNDLTGEAALAAAASVIVRGGVIAIKGAGGYHLAASAYNDAAVRRIREIKGRELKPLAVMFPDTESICNVCCVSERERELLKSDARPIVLLRRRESDISKEVYRESEYLGAFLPYVGYQKLLLSETGALVMTSANKSGEPIIFDDAAAREISSDGVLWHDRRIVTPLDDSVAAICCDAPIILRRARGYVPAPIRIKKSGEVFAAGGDLKASFGISKDGNLYLSQYMGDLENPRNLARWRAERQRMLTLLDAKPQYVVCDLHPGYHSAREVRALGIPVYGVQHHYAHALSVMAEYELTHAIGISFDGTGYGTDKTIWGGEFLLCDRHSFIRAGSLEPFSILGGDDAARDARKCAIGALLSAGIDKNVPDDSRYEIIRAAIRQNINTVQTTSVGRLFDAVSAILGVCMENKFEGACGEAVERAARAAAYGRAISLELAESADRFVIKTDSLLAQITSGGDRAELALGFHMGLAQAICDGARKMRTRFGESNVVLSGGVFQNRLLLTLAVEKLREHGFDVFWNQRTPLGDGGLALGQLYWSKEELGCVSRLSGKY